MHTVQKRLHGRRLPGTSAHTSVLSPRRIIMGVGITAFVVLLLSLLRQTASANVATTPPRSRFRMGSPATPRQEDRPSTPRPSSAPAASAAPRPPRTRPAATTHNALDSNATAKPTLNMPPLSMGRSPRSDIAPRKSKVACFQLSETGNADVLGENLGTDHYCVLNDICVAGGQSTGWYMFDSNRAGQTYDFPRQPLLQKRMTGFLPEEDTTLVEAAKNGRYVHDDDDDGQLTVLLRNSYCCGHIRHFLEPIPTLHQALRDLEWNDTRREAAGLPPDFNVRRAVLANPSVISGKLSAFNSFMLHSAVGGEGNPDFTFEDGVTELKSNDEKICFRRALVPGAIYHLFQKPQQGKAFRSAVWARLSRAKQAAVAKGGNATELLANEVDGKFRKSDERVIVYARRTSKRRITDDSAMMAFLEKAAGLVGARVLAVEMGKLDVVSQLTVAQGADVMIGLHGADLTNLLVQPDKAATVEMNPLFFFESGYREMAVSLGVGYTAWTCTAPSCAFGGNRERWDKLIGRIKEMTYDEPSRTISFPGYEPFKWPWMGYVASCKQCDRSSCCTPLAPHFYGALRDDNVKVGDHGKEILAVLGWAFQHLGWQLSDEAKTMLSLD